MRKPVSLLLVALLLAVLAGCASKKPSFEAVALQVPPLKEGEGRIVFFVLKRIRQAVWHPTITLNGEPVGRAVTGGYFYVDRPAGTYEVGHMGKMRQVEPQSLKTYELHAGETLYIAMVLHPGIGAYPARGPYTPNHLRSVLVVPDQARSILQSYRFVGELQEPTQH